MLQPIYPTINYKKISNLVNPRISGFTKVSNIFLVRKDLTTYEKMVMIVINMHKMNKGYCWPSEETIAREASCSISTVKKAIEGLQEKNLLRKTKVKKYRSNTYETTI